MKNFTAIPSDALHVIDLIVAGKVSAYKAGVELSKTALAESVALHLAPISKDKFKAFISGVNGLPDPGDGKPKTLAEANKQILAGMLAAKGKSPPTGMTALKAVAKKKLQVAAKPATNDPTDNISKEATLADMTITTQEAFLSHAAATPVALEAGADLPVGHPVAGTSKGAIYFIVAKAPGILVAMRWKGAQLSIRVAGPKIGDIADRLTATGLFANHMAEGYFSAHLGQQGAIDDLQGAVGAQMLYASVLAAIGSDLGSFTERAPYVWRNWKATPVATQEAPNA